MNNKIRNKVMGNDEKIKSRTIKQGSDKYVTSPYKFGDESFNIKYKMGTIEGEYNFIYDELGQKVLTGYRKDGKIIPDNWGSMINVTKDVWLKMVRKPEEELIPWVNGAYLD